MANGNNVMANYKAIKAMLDNPENDLSIVMGIMASECGARLHRNPETAKSAERFIELFESAAASGLGA